MAAPAATVRQLPFLTALTSCTGSSSRPLWSRQSFAVRAASLSQSRDCVACHVVGRESLTVPGSPGRGAPADGSDLVPVNLYAATNLHTCVTKKQTVRPISSGNRAATAVHLALLVSL